MVEAEAKEVSDDEMVKALEKSHAIIKEICKAQNDYIKNYEKNFGIEKAEAYYNVPDDSIYSLVKDFLTDDKMDVLYDKAKKEFQAELDNLDVLVREFLLEK